MYSNAISLFIALVLCLLVYPVFSKAFHSLGLVLTLLIGAGTFLAARRHVSYFLVKRR